MTQYVNMPITRVELNDLVKISVQEIEDFFRRNPHLIEPYRNRFIAACLCQGAALRYVGKGKGVKDFDIHMFYSQNPNKPRLSRAVKGVHHSVGNFPGDMKIDFVRTTIPQSVNDENDVDEERIIYKFLTEKPTANAWNLSQKAIVGLIPMKIFGKVIWPSVL